MAIKTVRELKQARSALLDQANKIVEKADTEARDMSTEERGQVDSLMQQAENMNADIEQREKLAGLRGTLVDGETQQDMDPTIGMSQSEVDRYSMVRAINGMLGQLNGDKRAADEGAFEMEASRAVAEKLGRDPQHGQLFVPYDFALRSQIDLRSANEYRRLLMADPTTGGYLVDTTLMTSSFIGLLRDRLVLQQAGAQVMGGLVGEFEIPKQTGAASFYMVGEDQDLTESTPGVDQIALKPRTGGGHMTVSRKLLRQASMDIENWMRAEMATIIAQGMGQMSFLGIGAANQPLGLKNISGIGSVAIGATGGAPTWAKIVEMETNVATANADVGRMSYIVNAKTRGKLKTTPKVAGQSEFIWDVRAGNTPVNGYAAHVTNLLPSNLTKSTGTGLSLGFFGNWADMIIAMWGTLEILVDPYSGSKSGRVGITGFQDFDVAVRHEESFSMIADMATV
jgi:HK97 family phage major capsid protein